MKPFTAYDNLRHKELLIPIGEALVMNFGRHSGTPLTDVPTDYLKWCIKELGDAPDEVVGAWRYELRKRIGGGTLEMCFEEEVGDGVV